MKGSILAILCTALIAVHAFGQKPKKAAPEKEVTYYDEKHVDYTNRIYDTHIHTVLLYTKSSPLEWPVISLNGPDRLVLQFDDLSEDIREMHYTFEHCTADWKPSDLHPMDYLSGFNSDIIRDFDFSFNTINSYTHYYLEFPNEQINITRSGNYIVKVYADADPSRVLLTARFMLYESRATVSPVVRPSSVVEDRDYRQEVDLTVNLGSMQILNPYGEIELVVLQNFRWDNAIRGVKPSFIKDNKLIYDYQGELTFDGTNEFRFFDAKSVRYRSEKVAAVELQPDGYHLILSADMRRSHLNYTFENDLNGRLLVKNDDMQDAALESDYITVHFSMPADAMFGPGNLYLFGQLSQWELDKNFRMTYNEQNSMYEKSLFLKQGYYNYMYLWEHPRQPATTDLTEGNHSRTENEYVVLVYFKDKSSFSDRLIGFKRFSSFDN